MEKTEFGVSVVQGSVRQTKKGLKNETGGGHPFKRQKKKEELTKLVKLNCLM